jgi:hypothetical protein
MAIRSRGGQAGLSDDHECRGGRPATKITLARL